MTQTMQVCDLHLWTQNGRYINVSEQMHRSRRRASVNIRARIIHRMWCSLLCQLFVYERHIHSWGSLARVVIFLFFYYQRRFNDSRMLSRCYALFLHKRIFHIPTRIFISTMNILLPRYTISIYYIEPTECSAKGANRGIIVVENGLKPTFKD